MSPTHIQDEGQRLSRRQVLISLSMGLLFWAIGVIGVRLCEYLGLFDLSWKQAALFLASLPLNWAATLLIAKLAKLNQGQILRSISVGLGIALLLDATFFGWYPELYCASPVATATQGASWILWGTCTFLAAALFEEFRRNRR